MALDSLKKKKDFEDVFKKGKGLKEGLLFLKVFFRSSDSKVENKKARFGIIIPQKVLKKATERNKLKRRIKAVLREKFLEIRPGFDFVIIPLSGIENKTFLEIKENLIRALKRAHLLS